MRVDDVHDGFLILGLLSASEISGVDFLREGLSKILSERYKASRQGLLFLWLCALFGLCGLLNFCGHDRHDQNGW